MISTNTDQGADSDGESTSTGSQSGSASDEAPSSGTDSGTDSDAQVVPAGLVMNPPLFFDEPKVPVPRLSSYK